MEIKDLINEIEQKAKKMNARMLRLELENKELKESVFEYLQQLDLQKKVVEDLQLKLNNKVISDHLPYDKKALQKEIDKFILLIDKCMASVKVNHI